MQYVDDHFFVRSDFRAMRRRPARPHSVYAPAHAPLNLLATLQAKRVAAIRRCAYHRWENDGRQFGRDIEDWLAAEADVDCLLERRDRVIREAAYFRWLSGGGKPGRAVDDWLAAEREVDARLGLWVNPWSIDMAVDSRWMRP